jgi:hypothetical protein
MSLCQNTLFEFLCMRLGNLNSPPYSNVSQIRACERAFNIDSDGAMSAFWIHRALKSIIASPNDE